VCANVQNGGMGLWIEFLIDLFQMGAHARVFWWNFSRFNEKISLKNIFHNRETTVDDLINYDARDVIVLRRIL
jgi:hypothetical protein